MTRADFFSKLPDMGAQFGNLILLRERDDKPVAPGASEAFLSSVIQFQPLARASFRDENGVELHLELRESRRDPVSASKVFEGSGLRLAQDLVVSGDEASLRFRIERTTRETSTDNAGREGGRGEVRLHLFGACLFSPQGVPYHWREESDISLARSGAAALSGEWTTGGIAFTIAASRPFDSLLARKLDDEEVKRTLYFTSFNLKKRYTFWVDEPSGGLGEGHARAYEQAANGGLVGAKGRNLAYEAEINLGALNGPDEVVLRFSVAPTASDGATHAAEGGGHAALVSKEERGWDEFLAGIAEFRASDAELERLYYTSWYILRSNRVRIADPRFPYPFTSVNKLHYYNQFFWDSAYQAIAWLWYNLREPAEDELKNFVVNQWRNGMIPYELFLYAVNGREWMDGDGKSAGMTQPPVIGIAALEIFRKFGDRDYIDYFYDGLLRYEEWLTLYRDLGKRGLSAYFNIWETGWDNSPRLDGCARNRVLDPAIESADFNAYAYYLRGAIIEMARVLGREVPSRVAQRMEATRKAMNDIMYDDIDGFYYDVVAGSDRKIKVKTAAGLIPLVTDIPDAAQRARLVHDYIETEDEFLSGCPVPSVSRSENSYNPIDFWRGANWPQITWTILYGIKESDPQAASKILDRFLSTTKRNGNCYEYYDAETGQGVGMPFQGWGALYTDMILRFVVGLSPVEGGFRFRPIATTFRDFSVRGLRLAGTKLAIERVGESWHIDFGDAGSIGFERTLPFRAVVANGGEAVRVAFDAGAKRNDVAVAGSGIELTFDA
jgi:hypothetical protein